MKIYHQLIKKTLFNNKKFVSDRRIFAYKTNNNMSKSVIIIPSRLKAKRLPNKPLLKINNIPTCIQGLKKLDMHFGTVLQNIET